MPAAVPNQAQNLPGVVVLLAGACRSPGREIAHALGRRGVNLVLFDGPAGGRFAGADPEELRLLGLNLRESGARTETFWGDLCDEAVVSRMVAKVLADFGSIDVLFLAPPLPKAALSWDPFDDGWETMVDVHLKGAWLLAKWVAPEMTRLGRGTILIDTSDQDADPTCVGGLSGLARSIDDSLAAHGVRACALKSLGEPFDPAGEILRFVGSA